MSENQAFQTSVEHLRSMLARRTADWQKSQNKYDQGAMDAYAISLSDAKKIEADKNEAYWERDQLVATLSKVYPSHLSRHEDDPWEDDWRNIVCVHFDIPSDIKGLVTHTQATWHIHDDELPEFQHLKYGENHWDGHTTPEKYARLRSIIV